MVWSQPRPRGQRHAGGDVVADGAFSFGDTTLNTILDGRSAWVTWGGTSRSAPVAASATALVYEARRKAVVPDILSCDPRSPPASTPRQGHRVVRKPSARDFGYDSMIQGAGSVEAGKATATAAGGRATVSP